MTGSRLGLCITCFGLLTACSGSAQTDPHTLPKAIVQIVGKAEALRAGGHSRQGIAALQQAAEQTKSSERAGALYALAIWRSLPPAVSDVGQIGEMLRQLGEHDPQHEWLLPYRLYLASLASDRATLLAAARELKEGPQAFPTVMAERAHFGYLVGQGLSEAEAGIAVIVNREHSPLLALRDLDRAMTREIEYFTETGQAGPAGDVSAARETLRTAYLSASRHLLERLSALALNGKTAEHASLLAESRRQSYLHNAEELTRVVSRLTHERAWRVLIRPLLDSEVAFVSDPPDLPKGIAEQAPMRIDAESSTKVGRATRYQGNVRIRLAGLSIQCDEVKVAVQADTRVARLSGRGAVVVKGMPIFNKRITAQAFVLRTDRLALTLDGKVRLSSGTHTQKYDHCVIGPDGEVTDKKSALIDFRNATNITAKLALLPRIGTDYDDKELPSEVQYLVALSLLSPHLTWHSARPQLPDKVKAHDDEWLKEQWEHHMQQSRTAWQEAHTGESWMVETPLSGPKEGEVPQKDEKPFFWRIKDPTHPDIGRATTLLRSVTGPFRRKARDWVLEIERNNTVVTFDVPGALLRGRDGTVVMDVRNAEEISFSIYRVTKPDDLRWVCRRIGKDFIYRDYGLQYENTDDLDELHDSFEQEMRQDMCEELVEDLAKPEFEDKDRLSHWTASLQSLGRMSPRLRHRYRRPDWDDFSSPGRGWRDGPDAWLFDDACEAYRERLQGRYRPRDRTPSSWQVDRMVKVPGVALEEAGAYILVAEANGVSSYAPILVEPLSMTLRRSRDGVFVLVSDTAGIEPVPRAEISSTSYSLNTPLTDQGGAAFAKLSAVGDCSIIAHHEGRYAIGGFGRVFEGLYVLRSPHDRDYWYEGLERDIGEWPYGHRGPLSGAVYEDRFVVAAYTDRPTYRPGQRVHFKLILRHLAPNRPDGEKRNPDRFRSDDFDLQEALQVPPTATPVRYEVINPKGRVVADGRLKSNDFGTSAGSLQLNQEAATGPYSLRLTIDGLARIVPGVFRVKYYRRPNFEVVVEGVPDKVKRAAALDVSVKSTYYFGKPLAQAEVDVRVVRSDQWRPIVRRRGKTGLDGCLSLALDLDSKLTAHTYYVICSVTDDSGRTVTRTLPYEVTDGAQARKAERLASLPRFVTLAGKLTLKQVGSVVVRSLQTGTETSFSAKDGTTELSFSHVGPHKVVAGDEEVDLFVYGGYDHPVFGSDGVPLELPSADMASPPAWVNLADYESFDPGQSWYEWPSRYSGWGRKHEVPRPEPVLALFDRQHVTAGEPLRVLVYVAKPHEQIRLLFTLEGLTVVDYHTVLTDKADKSFYHLVEIPVTSRCLPNVYVQARVLAVKTSGQVNLPLLLREAVGPEVGELPDELPAFPDELGEEGEDPAWCRIDVIDPNPPRINGEQLDVTIKTDRPMYEPGETVNVTIQVTDLAGRPKDAELSLSAVDASVYAFGEGREPQLAAGFGASHPARRFLPKPWRSSLGSSWSPVTLEQESLQEMTVIELDSVREAMVEDLQSARKELGRVVPDIRRGYMPPTHLAGMLPVSTLPMARMRTDFRETAAWLPQLRTGADGEARASFLLPDSLTRYRLTAVGLTRQTQIGSARATIRATMPLSVQTILPRFAVAKDVLKAVGLIHNTTDEAKSVDVLWRVKGPVQPTPLTNLVCQVRRVDDQTVVTSRVPVPARGSTAVGLWLTMTGPGEVTVSFQGSAGRDADAEERTLLVKGLGRRRDIALTGQFTGEHKLVLPKGFVPESLRVSLSGKQRVDVAHSLEGLHGLIAFPHGCVEQTMSRFLPAVMLKHAARQSAIDLPDGLEKKLPEVLARGLARLYNFQHKDGGWGWWEKDASNNQMTVYVLYGLARCHLSGVEIDESVVTRGSDYLKKQLRSGALARQSGRLTHGSRSVAGRELEARAWFVLSLNGTVDRDALAGYVRDRGRDDTFSISGLCNLALACRAAGLSNEGAQLWGMCKQWEPKTVDEKALYLMGQLQFRERLKACLATATDLAGDRKGHGWGNTRATSWAIEALAGVVPFVPPSDPSGQKDALQVWVGERLIIDDSDTAPNAPPANGTFRLVRSVALGATELAYRTQLPIMCRATGDQRYLYTVSGQGHQHLDEMEAYGESLKITRRYQTLQGVPVNGPLAVGQVVECHVTVTVTGTAHDYVMLEDRRPAGCEYADDRLAGDLAAKAANTEFRDDRLVVFFTRLAPGTYSLVYYLRAETPGTSHVLPGAIYPMYAADQRGETASDTIRISE